jgi:hypothetical protein
VDTITIAPGVAPVLPPSVSGYSVDESAVIIGNGLPITSQAGAQARQQAGMTGNPPNAGAVLFHFSGDLQLRRFSVTSASTDPLVLGTTGRSLDVQTSNIVGPPTPSTGLDPMVAMRISTDTDLTGSTVAGPFDRVIDHTGGVLTIDRSTVARNGPRRSASLPADVVVSHNGSSPARVGVTRSTVSNRGGVVAIDVSQATGAALFSSIVEDTTGLACVALPSGSVPSSGYNLVTDNTCHLTSANQTDLQNVTAQLNPLADNGGPIPLLTFLPMATSPAVDRIPFPSNFCVSGSVDERRVTRPDGPACDVGAVEGHS